MNIENIKSHISRIHDNIKNSFIAVNEKTTNVETNISTHNTSNTSHNDIRLLVEGLTTRLNTLANSDDTTLDQLSEIVAYIKNNKSLIDGITTNKVNVSNIIDNLTTSVSNKPLSAKMGVELKKLIDNIVIPTKLADLTGDSTHRVVTDTEKSTWNNKSNFSGKFADLTSKPTTLSGYGITDGATEVQIENLSQQLTDEVSRIEDSLEDYAKKTSIPTKTSELKNDSDFISEVELANNLSNYITKVELDAILAKIEEALTSTSEGNNIFGYIDENNNIILSGNLADNSYTIKYEMDDGSIINIGELVLETEPEVPSYTNLLPLSVDANGNDFVGTHVLGGDGYKYGYSISESSGEQVAQDKVYCSGFIPIENINDYIRIANISLSSTANNIVFYDKNKKYLKGYTGSQNGFVEGVEVMDNYYQFRAMTWLTEQDNIGFFRFSCGGIGDETIVTVNEEILESSYTNQLLLAKNTDGTSFVGTNNEKGYKTGFRIKGSSGQEEAMAGVCCTGYMKASYYEYIYIKNITIHETSNYNQIVYYDENYNKVLAVTATNWGKLSDDMYRLRASGIGEVSNMVYFRLCCAEISDDTIITVNEEIV